MGHYTNLPTDVASLIAYIIALILYGFYVALFISTMWLLRLRNYKGRVVVGSLVALFILAALQIIAGSFNIYNAFVHHAVNPGPAVYLAAFDNVTSPMRDVLLFVSCAISDGLLTWRLYVVWNRCRRIIILPLILLTGAIVAGLALSAYDVKQVLVNDDRYWRPLSAWTIAALALTLALNLLVTGLIAGRLWYIGVKMDDAGGQVESRFRAIVFTVIESGAIYATSIAVLMLVYAGGIQVAIYAAMYILPQIVSIVPTLIIFQLNFRFAALAVSHSRTITPPNGRQKAQRISRSEDKVHQHTFEEAARTPRNVEMGIGSWDPTRTDGSNWNACMEMEVRRFSTSLHIDTSDQRIPGALPTEGKRHSTDSTGTTQFNRGDCKNDNDIESHHISPRTSDSGPRSSPQGTRGHWLPEIHVLQVVTTGID